MIMTQRKNKNQTIHRKLAIFITLTLIPLFTTACRDTVCLDQLQKENTLVVYAFPTTRDTIPIMVSVAKAMNRQQQGLCCIQIRCTVNGADDRLIYLGTENYDGFPVASFFAIGKHQVGDSIVISARSQDFAEARGTTIIPPPGKIGGCQIDTILYKGNNYTQLRLEIQPSSASRYYAVRLEGWNVLDEGIEEKEYKKVETTLEPLLNYYTDSDIEFGTWNDYYHRMYTFEKPETEPFYIRLCTTERRYTSAYRTQLFSLSPEFFLLLKSLNDTDNNDIGKYGMAFVRPTFSNVIGGYGCVAAYTNVNSEWMK